MRNLAFCKVHFYLIATLILVKLVFSYLLVEPHYLQKGLISNVDKFNFWELPKNFSSQLEFVLAPLNVIFIFLYRRWFKPSSFIFIVFVFSLASSFISSYVNETSFFEGVKYSLKIFSPIFFFCVLIIYSKKMNTNLSGFFKLMIMTCALLSFIAIVFFNPSMNRVEEYLPVYFANIHTTSYIIVTCLMAVNYLIFRKLHPIYLLISTCLITVILFFGYGVRTALIIFFLFSIPLLVLSSNEFKKTFFQIIFLLPFALTIFFLFYFSTIDWEEFSSGRLSMYFEKLNLIREFNILELAFGRGSGSDLIKTKAWWWEVKGSHSDVITTVFENGLIYFFIIILTFLQVLFVKTTTSWMYLTTFCGYLFSSVISNGIAVRPLAGYVFFSFLAFLLIDNYKHTKHIKLND